MAVILRIVGWSVLTSLLGAGIGLVLFGQNPEFLVAVLALACAAIPAGAIAGAALEIVTALRERPFH